MQKIKTRFGRSGRTVIPTEYRQRLGPEVGDEIIDNLDEEGLRPYFPAQAVEMVDLSATLGHGWSARYLDKMAAEPEPSASTVAVVARALAHRLREWAIHPC